MTAPQTLPGCGCHPWAKAQCFCAAHARMIGLPVHPDAVAVRVYGGRIRIARWRRLAGAGKLRSGV